MARPEPLRGRHATRIQRISDLLRDVAPSREICIRDFHGGEVIFDSRYLYLFTR